MDVFFVSMRRESLFGIVWPICTTLCTSWPVEISVEGFCRLQKMW